MKEWPEDCSFSFFFFSSGLYISCKLTSDEALLAAIHEEGLDTVADFKLNTDYASLNSVRLNCQEDGSYLLYTVGERGIDWQETFRDPKEACYHALQTVRLVKGEAERMMRR